MHALLIDPQIFEEWTNKVRDNHADLRWTATALERQIVLINSMEKDAELLAELKKVKSFQVRGKPIFGPQGSHKLASTTGSRNEKLGRVLQYILAEGRCASSAGSEVSPEGSRWHTLTEKEISDLSQKPSKASGGAPGSSGGAADAGSQSLGDQIKLSGEIADAHESQILQQSADGERPRRLPNLMEGGAVFESPPPAHSEPLRGLDSAVSRGKTTRGKGRKGSRTRGRGKEVAPD